MYREGKIINIQIEKIITKDLIYAVINYVIRLLVKPILLLGVPFFLSKNDQGYWYTFGSLAALTTFADLGFTSIITQFAAHEITEGIGTISARLSSLFKFILKWVISAMSISIPVIFSLGIYLFNKEDSVSIWGIPWTIYCVSTAINFVIQSILAFFEGINQIAKVQKIKSVDAIIINLFAVVLLYFNKGIYSLGIAMFAACIVDIVLMYIYFKEVIIQLLLAEKEKNKWFSEIFPLLIKYSVSWICGYIIFQVYNPIVFHLYGSELAGKVGYSITIISSICSISNIWIYIVIPKFNIMAEKKQWNRMDKELMVRLPLCAATFIVGTISFLIILRTPIIGTFLEERILDSKQLLILAMSYLGQIIVNGFAVYLRAHKKEPLMSVSIVSAVYSLMVTIICLYFGNFKLIFLGYFSSFVFSIPMTIYIFKKFKEKWH